ncbi:MAG TPA: hypothetical protein V6D31_08585 [Candidatus Sericytochromatia bacterium]
MLVAEYRTKCKQRLDGFWLNQSLQILLPVDLAYLFEIAFATCP